MRQILDDIEMKVLKIITNSDKPMGSWAIENKLKEENVEISAATVGRILSRLENSEFLEKQKYKGRTVTPEGKLAIKRAETINIINYHKEKLDEIITTEILENFIMIIQARKAIEKETCRLATKYITKSELEKLEKIIDLQEEKFKNGESIANEDIEFHKTIAKASRNVILESMYNIISTYKQQSLIFEDLRKQINSPYSAYHRKIYEAIKNGDENEAVRIMEEHLENLTNDVLTFWSSYNKDDSIYQ